VGATVGTWTDGGGDVTSLLRLNATEPGNTADLTWRIVNSAEDPGANHTPGGDFAYRTTGPIPLVQYGSSLCSVAETPVLTVGATTLNLTYWERHQMEAGWDGVAIEYSRNGGPWTDLPAPSNASADGCMMSDVTSDYATLACTGDPPANACRYPSNKPVITGPRNPPDPVPLDCTASTTAEISPYARRCHRLTGLTNGDKIQFRWRFVSDPGLEFKGFYLDDIAVTNIRLPNVCTVPAPGVPVLTGAASRKSHGAAGSFDVVLPLDGTGVEPRRPSGNHTVVLHFDRPLQSGNAAVTSGTGTVGAVTFSGNDMVVELSGVPDRHRLTLSATNLTAVSGGVLNSASVTMGFLIGDTTGDGSTNSGDAQQTRNRSGSTTAATNFRSDVNRDGTINSGDAAIVRSASGQTIP
jgi:hypothetical protein